MRALRVPAGRVSILGRNDSRHFSLDVEMRRYFDTFRFLVGSRDGAMEWKRLHEEGILHTPGLIHFGKSFVVFKELLASPQLQSFDASEFLLGARAAYQMVNESMLDLDLVLEAEDETCSEVAEAEMALTPKQRLRAVLAPEIFDAMVSAAEQMKLQGIVWEVTEIEVVRCSIEGIAVWTDTSGKRDEMVADQLDEISGESGDGGASLPSLDSVSEEVNMLDIAVGYDVNEQFVVTLPDGSKTEQGSLRCRNWIFRSRLTDNMQWQIIAI